MEYILHLLILVGIYTMLSQSLSLSIGYGGMISLAHAGFYGMGAYTTAWLSVNHHFPYLITLPISMLLCGLLALVVSVIAMRTVDSYFIICTLGIQVIFFTLLYNWTSVTGGGDGIPGIPGISTVSFLGYNVKSRLAFLLVVLIFTAVLFYFLKKLTKSSFGLTLRALSEDEIFTQSLGKNVYISKVTAFTISAMLAAIPGTLYAHYISFIDPSSFTINESIFILSIVIVAGTRNLWGCLAAASILVLLPEILRFIGIPSAVAANIRQIIYGGMLIAMMFIGNKKIDPIRIKYV